MCHSKVMLIEGGASMMDGAHKMLTWCRVKAAALTILLAANQQGPPCGHRPALAADHRPQLHTHHKTAEV